MTVVVAFPEYGSRGLPPLMASNLIGVTTVTVPGPRYLVTVRIDRRPVAGHADRSRRVLYSASSSAHMSIGIGVPTVAVRAIAVAMRRHGAGELRPGFLEAQHRRRVELAVRALLRRLHRRDVVVGVHVERNARRHAVDGERPGDLLRLAENSFGTVTMNMPKRRRVRKCVGWPMSGLPGSKWLLGPIGTSTSA